MRFSCAAIVATAVMLFATAVARAAIQVHDDLGAVVRVERPAMRIVSIAPHLTEQLFAIGVGTRIVATTEYADYPAAARDIARVGRAHHVDIERIAALKPDLIVIWGSGFPPATVAALRRLGVALFVSEPRKLDDIADSMLRLGTLTAAPDAAAAAEALRNHLAQLREAYSTRPPVKVFYEIWPRPLMTLSGKHVVSDAIALCGGTNVFGTLTPLAPQVSTEAVLAADPDAIVSAEADGAPSGALARWRAWPKLAAVRNDALVTLRAETINRHGPRIADGVRELCAALEAVRQRR